MIEWLEFVSLIWFSVFAMAVPDEVFNCCCDFGFEIVRTNPIPTTDECSQCSEMPDCWTLTISGIQDVDCSLCGNLNGTFELQHQNTCRFDAESVPLEFGPPFCNEFTAHYRLNYISAVNRWDLTIEGGAGTQARWSLAAGSWNCEDSNTMSFAADSGLCTNYPSSVTLTPGC